MGTTSDKDWKDWKVFMQMILTWEEKNKDGKRQFLSKFQLIDLADKSDADRMQQIANSQIKGYYKLQGDTSTIQHLKGDPVEKDETIAKIKKQVKSFKDVGVQFDYMDSREEDILNSRRQATVDKLGGFWFENQYRRL
ncbi:PREDICTED: uncharacterized protein LOC109586132 [Amphimedon queenslandica]|uniref:Uncharacterized protein n=1 Tax=Amphimedon queenslandica TaxID=400682 RepID=A0AAN0JM77_AMPQE|nr:PREDICTED: uncharacterized protein LOC109586132 [Amphimedon queenslandica]|eukprot:XP_019857861.1 PREDICTED: uncharacterized protein LOC109586132 [Amphimedon queenslandica]